MRVSFEGGMLNVSVEGSEAGLPLFVLPGGPGLSYMSYKPYCDFLAEHVRLIYIDPPGCGESSQYTKESMDMEQYIHAIQAVKAHLKLAKLALLGFSYGSMLAMKYMVEFPEEVITTILVGGAPTWHFLDEAKENLAMRGTPEQKVICEKLWAGTFESLEQAQEFFAIMAPLYSLSASTGTGEAAPPPPSVNIEALNVAFAKEFWHFDLVSQLAKTQCSVLALTGEKDWVNDPKYLDVLESNLPEHGKHCIIKVPDCGHPVQKDKPDFFKSALIFWLKEQVDPTRAHRDICETIKGFF